MLNIFNVQETKILIFVTRLHNCSNVAKLSSKEDFLLSLRNFSEQSRVR